MSNNIAHLTANKPTKDSSFCVLSFAKLNLFLHITGKLDNNYHAIQSVFVRIDMADTLHFSHHTTGLPTNNPFVFLKSVIMGNVNDNLIIKAANALLKYIQAHHIGQPCHITISLEKQIPIGAGLGGGSSNAAATLCTLNKLWQCHLDTSTLITIAKGIGADVPFFVLNLPSAIAEGIGETLTPISLPPQAYLLICPAVHNSTASFFHHPNLVKNTPILSHNDIINRQDEFVGQLCSPFYNAFEAIALACPTIEQAYRALLAIGDITATTPRLTGTGSTVFLPLGDTNLDIVKPYIKALKQHSKAKIAIVHAR